MAFKNLAIILLVTMATYLYFKYGHEAPDQLVQNFHITSDKNGHNLEFDFESPVRYLGHYPENQSDILQIKLRAIGFNDFTENLSLVDRFIPSSEVKNKLLEEVRYEGDVPGGPFIVVRFTKPMQFSIGESNGLKNLIVSYK
ncbi:MAG: hypothetical protein GXP08_16560 [Gammaproteobacteria bacterium]|nr:hypothetical protein [Gammaproteobacteria bacterium]